MKPPLIRPDWPAPPRVHAFATTRSGGFSRGAWRGFNLGMHCGDEAETVLKNRNLLASLLPAPPQWLRQVHGIKVVTHPGVAREEIEGDAVVTSQIGRVCAVLTADCLPVVLCNRKGTKVGVAHAGWRGLAGGVIEASLDALQESPENILAWLGPAIGPDAYQVGDDVRNAFAAVDPVLLSAFKNDESEPEESTVGKRSWLLNLYEAARLRLAIAGVASVYGGEYCTWSEPERFFSYRRDGMTGRATCVAWLS